LFLQKRDLSFPLNFIIKILIINLTKTVANIYCSDEKMQGVLAATMSKIKAEGFYIRPATERQAEKFIRRFEE